MDVKAIDAAIKAEAAETARDAMIEKQGPRYPAIATLWRNAWPQFVPLLDYDIEIRRLLSSTNAIESLNARYRRTVNARGHFPPRRRR